MPPAPSNPTACDVDRGRMTKDIALETVEERLEQDMPQIEEAILEEAAWLISGNH
jgi:hypothetical protein